VQERVREMKTAEVVIEEVLKQVQDDSWVKSFGGFGSGLSSSRRLNINDSRFKKPLTLKMMH